METNDKDTRELMRLLCKYVLQKFEPVDPCDVHDIDAAAQDLLAQLFPDEIPGNPILLTEDKKLKVTITDGDYTLHEGIDYRLHYFRGKGDVKWTSLAVGQGKYDHFYLFGYKHQEPNPEPPSMREKP